MKQRLFSAMLLTSMGVAFSTAVSAADATDASPYDSNPACLERTTDASTGACVPKVEGTPRHTYAPPGQPGARPGASTGATGSTGTGTSTTAAGSRDGGRSRATSSAGK